MAEGSAYRKAALAGAWLVLGAGCSQAPAPPAQPRPAAVAVKPAPQSAAAGNVVTGRAPASAFGAPSIVVLTPAAAASAAQAATPVLDQVSMTFTPAVLFVRTGQPARFRNSDGLLHNVRVRHRTTAEGTFNVALPQGGSYEHTMPRDGIYDVGCDIHPYMSAVIFAAATPFTALVETDGTFIVRDVPPGSYTATLHGSEAPVVRPVEVGGGRTELDLTAAGSTASQP